MLIIPVADIFSQTLNCVLGNQACTINLYQRSTRNQAPATRQAGIGPVDAGIQVNGNTVMLVSIPGIPDAGQFLEWQSTLANVGVSSGSWYWEVIVGTASTIETAGGTNYPIGYRLGIATLLFQTTYEYADTLDFGIFPIVGMGQDSQSASVGWDVGGAILFNGAQLNSVLYPYKTGDVLGFAFNATTGQLLLFQNGVQVFTVANIPFNTWFPAADFSSWSSIGTTVFNATATFTFSAFQYHYTVPVGFEGFVSVPSIGTDGIDALYLDLFVNSVPLVNGVVCQNLNRVIRMDYLGFIGDLMWQDTQGTNDPSSPGLGMRYLFCYLEATDVAGAAYNLNKQLGLA
jgi:hypothetical protein